MIDTSLPEFQALSARFRERFDDIIPLLQIPTGETLEGLGRSIERCFAVGKNILDEIYNVKNDGSKLY